MRRFSLVFAVLIAATASRSEVPAPVAPAERPGADAGESSPRRRSSEHLPNLVQVHPRVFSGGLPEGDAAFAELRDLGVKTVVSVDGAKPDVATARRHGLRYVHLPHGYDGVPDTRVRELAKAVLELEGPIYIHCHHGKHRSPAAACVACVAAGMLPPERAVGVLQLAGTSTDYRGLYESAERARPLDATLLAALQVEFQESVDVPPLADAMVTIEHQFDRVKEHAAAEWKDTQGRPDPEAAHALLLLRESFAELQRAVDTIQLGVDQRRLMHDSEELVAGVEADVRAWLEAASSTTAPESLAAGVLEINDACRACHARFRDAPRREGL